MMKVRGRFAVAILSVCLAYLNSGSVARAGTLLPNGEQQFFSFDGTTPNAAGCVYFYTPGTLVPKATYLDAAQVTSNTNPVQLDAAGRAIIYGTGTYRQIVKATGPNAGTPCSPAGAQIWDQITASTDSSATIFAGSSSGTPNSITVTAPAFSGADGQVINYISTNTNTGGATFNPSGFGAIQIVRDGSTGPAALVGGELVATNSVSLIYDATAGTFHILSPVNWPNTSGVPVGMLGTFPGFVAPTGYAFAYGQAVSRTTYSALFATYTSAQSASLSSGSPTITGLTDTTQFGAGHVVEALGIPPGTTISSCAATTCTLSANATSTRTGTVTFFAYGNGDGSTTFNIPDMRGLYMAGRTNMGAPAVAGKTNITTAFLGESPTALGGGGGSQSSVLVTGNLPPYTPSGTITNGAITFPSVAVTSSATGATAAVAIGPFGGSAGLTAVLNPSQAASSFTGTPQGGTSTAFSRLPPTAMMNWIVRLVQ